ncbi:MAG: hypothetical protein IJK40_07430 [Clostridia bacterium]|nr:hypothetical protein [Clostridia bacterium]
MKRNTVIRLIPAVLLLTLLAGCKKTAPSSGSVPTSLPTETAAASEPAGTAQTSEAQTSEAVTAAHITPASTTPPPPVETLPAGASNTPTAAAPVDPEEPQAPDAPVTEFTGNYQAGRPGATVETGSGDRGMRVTIHWSSGASENTEWFLEGDLDSDTLVMRYKNCRCVDTVYNEDGSVNETVRYANGTGSLRFANGGFTWQDDVENMGKDLFFERIG